MTTAIKRRRGTTSQHATFTGLEGEITVDTTKDTLVVHDGATAGGFALLREDLSNNTNVASTSTAQTFTNKTFGDNPTFSAGTANGVAYLNGSKVLTTGSALTFDGTNFAVGNTSPSRKFEVTGSGDVYALVETTGTTGTVGYLFGDSASDSVGRIEYVHTSDVMQFTTGGSERMRLTSTGLGIGTTSPSSRLEIAKSGLSSATGLTFGTVVINDTSGTVDKFATIDFTSTIVGNPICRISSVATATGSFLRFGTSNAYGSGVTNTALTIDPSGNLGLGVTPKTWTVGKAIEAGGAGSAFWGVGNGDSRIVTNTYFDGLYRYASSSVASTMFEASGGSYKWFTAPSGTAGNPISFTQAMTLDASGNLLVGSTTAGVLNNGSCVLTVANGTDAVLSSVKGNTVELYSAVSSAEAYIGTRTSHPLWFFTNNTERMRINSSGNVGIGTSSPGRPLQITNNGSASLGITDTSTGGATISINPPQNSSGLAQIDVSGANALRFNTNSAERMRIDSSGNLLVGTTTASPQNNSNAAFVAGSAAGYGSCFIQIPSGAANGYGILGFFAGNVSLGNVAKNGTNTVAYNTSSDYRLKENIQPMQNALGVVQQLNPVTYTWKADGSDGQGFIAHELQAVVPDCVTGEKDAVDEEGNPVYQGIDTSFLVATLTAAIKELKAELDATKAEVAALKGK